MEEELKGAVSGCVGLSVDRFTCSYDKIVRSKLRKKAIGHAPIARVSHLARS